MRVVGSGQIPLNVFSGFVVRGVFFRFLKKFDASFTTAIHEGRTLSPYSVSPIETLEGRGIFRGEIRPGFVFQMRMTALADSVAEALKGCLLTAQSPMVEVNGVETHVAGIHVKHWSPVEKFETFENMKFEVEFRSPTYFRNTQKWPSIFLKLIPRGLRKPVRPIYRYVVLPDPYLLLRNLARLYRQFGDPNFRYKSFSEWLLEGGVALEDFRNLRCYKFYDDQGRWSRGFTGRVVFTVPKDLYDRRMAKVVLNLLEFAGFSNVGGNRTAGFGVVKYRVLGVEDEPL